MHSRPVYHCGVLIASRAIVSYYKLYMGTLFSYTNNTLNNFGINPDVSYFGNTVGEYVGALFIFVFALIVFKLFQWSILGWLNRLAKKTETDLDDTLIKIVKSLRPPFYSFLAFYVAIQALSLNDFIATVVNVVLIIWVIYQVIIGLQILIDYSISRRFAREGDATARSALSVLGRIFKGIIWGFGILLILSNLGINISSLIAGLGIGGIAVAFALQNILSDLFSSFAIYFDKPFQIGDFIVVGDHVGTVEKVGIKTTRLRALQGEEIVISNRELTSARVQNFKKMSERRIQFSFGVVYQIPAEKLQKIPAIVKEVVEAVPLVRFDRAHFKKFDDSALLFEVVYYMQTPDYSAYMDAQQAINLGLFRKLEKEKIEFAYPTRTIFLEK